MKDPRIQKIAELIVNHSIKVQPNEDILIQTNTEIELSVVREIIKEIHKAGGFDGQLVRKDGRFVIPELEVLNPKRVLAQ